MTWVLGCPPQGGKVPEELVVHLGTPRPKRASPCPGQGQVGGPARGGMPCSQAVSPQAGPPWLTAEWRWESPGWGGSSLKPGGPSLTLQGHFLGNGEVRRSVTVCGICTGWVRCVGRVGQLCCRSSAQVCRCVAVCW